MQHNGPLQENQKRCAHRPCQCLAEGGNRYCSAWCRDVAAGIIPEGDSCECGHEDCASGGQ
jgi:hypothetical protein